MSEDKVEAKVTKVLGPTEIVINKGFTHGVRQGKKFLVYALGDELFDPDTRESLGRMELIRGKGKVTHCQEKMSILETYEYEESGGRVVRQEPWLYPTGTLYYEADRQKKSFVGVEEGDLAREIEY